MARAFGGTARRRRWAAVSLHGLTTLLLLSALIIPVVTLRESVSIRVGGAASDAAVAFSSHAAINAAPATAPTKAPATAPAEAPAAAPATLTATMVPDTAPLVRTRKLSLIDVIVGATGTAFDPETPLVLHGGQRAQARREALDLLGLLLHAAL